ncbi:MULTISPECIES: type II secretion system protein GspM [unclassified Ensifer]|uniref:type II secretion system protein GspM n=1 Tax=unclassified Ensifer TaxID=2633371 RepID=UPI0007102ED5|nr:MULTISPECIES: type II secretion system protein GspM [unclassified Ensifer]KQW43189.1 hypothetical protein ASD02_35505 [Ensifer sp. Root1252]KRC67127.1 hypothetical protein ASE32_35735 [Ensifer sp. Root231]KRC93706.1 hypothetical protein ASE47_35590 [Ensifer sp. Root258]
MTELLIRLMNAPTRMRQLVAFGCLLAAGLVAVSLVLSAIQLLDDQNAQIDEQRRDLARINALLAQKPMLDAKTSLPSNQTIFLEGGDIGVLQAKLQDIVASIALSAGSTISSASVTPEAEVNGVRSIGLRVSFEGRMKSTQDTVVGIETSQPQLVVQRADMRASNVPAGETLTQPLQISTQLTIYASIRPADPAPATGKLP